MPKQPAVRVKQPTLEELWGQAIVPLEMAAGSELSDRELWRPNEVQEGRGIELPDGRVVSPQRAALESPADELLFGGSPGGGKTDMLLGLALTAHYRSIIFRREFTQFEGAEGMIQRSRDIVGEMGSFNQNSHIWRNLPGGRALEFGAAKSMADTMKYKGRPHDLKAFDEITEIPETVYRLLIGWLRTSTVGQRTRVVCTSNPPLTDDGMWVLKHWGAWHDKHHKNPAKSGELRWYVVGEDGTDIEVDGPKYGWQRPPAVEVSGKMIEPRSRTFVKSRVEDNPTYMQTGYTSVLDSLPEPYRSLLRAGDFQAARSDHSWQVIPTAWVVAAQTRWQADGRAGQPLVQAGNDPSRGGQDEFVIAKRYGDWVAPLTVHQAKEAPDGIIGAGLVVRALGDDREVLTQIDIEGEAGSSVYDQAKQVGLNVIPLKGSAKSSARDKSGKLGFFNKRAEWHWKMREALDPSNETLLALPPDSQLKADLCAPRWEITVRGIKIEEKDRIKERLGRSPDRGEAVMYACVPKDSSGPHGLLFDRAPAEEKSEAENEVAELERLLHLK